MAIIELLVGLCLLALSMTIAIWLVGAFLILYLTRYQVVREAIFSPYTSDHLNIIEKTAVAILIPILTALLYRSVLSAVWAETG